MNALRVAECCTDGAACKYKWPTLFTHYKNVADYINGASRHRNEYFYLKSKERGSLQLPKVSQEDINVVMHEWLQQHRIMNCPHIRDLLHPND